MSDEKSSPRAYLLINGSQIYYLEKEETTLGRSSECDLVLGHQGVSRSHAKISLMNKRYLLTDQNSSGGSYINGRPVVHKLLDSGDVITLAMGIKIVFSDDESLIPKDAVHYSPASIIDGKVATSKLEDSDVKAGSEEEEKNR